MRAWLLTLLCVGGCGGVIVEAAQTRHHRPRGGDGGSLFTTGATNGTSWQEQARQRRAEGYSSPQPPQQPPQQGAHTPKKRCPSLWTYGSEFVLNVVITTSDLPPARATVEPLIDRLVELHEATFGSRRRGRRIEAPVHVVIDAWPDKKRSTVTAWARDEGPNLAAYGSAVRAALGVEVAFDLVRPFSQTGRDALRRAFNARPCEEEDEESGAKPRAVRCHIAKSDAHLSAVVAPTVADCDSLEQRCVLVDKLGSTLPYVWSVLRSLRCGALYVVHFDGDVRVKLDDRPSHPWARVVHASGWARLAAAVLATNPAYFAVHLVDYYHPYGQPCALDLAPAKCAFSTATTTTTTTTPRAYCDQPQRDEHTRDWRGVVLRRPPLPTEAGFPRLLPSAPEMKHMPAYALADDATTICASEMVALRNNDTLDTIAPHGSAHWRNMREAAHLSLEVFLLDIRRFVDRWPLKFAAADLELVIEASHTTHSGAIALPSQALGIVGKMADQFIFGTSYKAEPDPTPKKKKTNQ